MIRKPPSLSVETMGESTSQDHIQRVERELAKEDSLFRNMIEQAPGMIGMAGMFVVTIFLGIWLQPWFDSAGLQAFGESGSTQARWIVLELLAIFAFTFLILWLAKKHLQHFIKYGLLFVLFLALCYTTIPGAHILLVPDVETEPFEFTEVMDLDEEVVSINADGSMITQVTKYTDDMFPTFEVNKRSANMSLEWSKELDSYPGAPIFTVTEGIYGITVTNGAWIWSFDKEDGDILSKYACFELDGWDNTLENLSVIPEIIECVTALEIVENANGDFGEAKGALYITTPENKIVRRNTFHGTNETVHQSRWDMPQLQLNSDTIFHNKQYDEDSLLIATETRAIMIEIEELADAYNEPGPRPDKWEDQVSVEWQYEVDDNFTAFNVITNPWDDDEEVILTGTESGEIKVWIIDDEIDEIFEEEERFGGEDSFEGPILSINSFDLDEEDGDELWITDADGVHGLFYESLTEYVTIEIDFENVRAVSSEGATIQMVIDGKWNDTFGNPMIGADFHTGEFDSDTMYNSYGIQLDDTAILVGLGLAVVLMVALIIRPEWYVVNTVGVLVGAGVIVMLGVTFVPTLIVIFMVLAAIYDAWAVYKSKHMLDLADTMIGLNLPILLVAPQESGYSMLEESDSLRPAEKKPESSLPADASKHVKMVKRKKPKEAMFMGLGDVIFPGMLVLSCVNFVPSNGLAVGLCALIGGLIGYLVLMTYVASGRPQAGLPLLNGGAIIGYIIGGLLFVGSAAFSFGISL